MEVKPSEGEKKMKDIIEMTVSHVFNALNHDYSELADNGFMDFEDLDIVSTDELDFVALEAIEEAISNIDVDKILNLVEILNYYCEYKVALELFMLFARQLKGKHPEESTECLLEIWENLPPIMPCSC